MRKLILAVALGGCAFFGLANGSVAAEGSGNAAAEAAAAELSPVDVQEVSGFLDEIQANAIEKALVRSAEAGSQALILQVNTRGAVIPRERMVELLEQIAASKVPVAIWVGPSGSRLYGMAAQMLAAADVTAMAPGSRIGKMGTPVAAEGVTFDFGASTDLLQTETLGFADARKTGALKFASNDEGVPVLKNMVFTLDGLTVDGPNSEKTVLDTVAESLDGTGQVVREATTVRFFKLGLLSRLFHTVASSPVTYLLLVIGLSLLIFEFFTAGIGIAGLVGAVCSVLACFGLAELPIRGVALVAMLLAMVAFAVDVQVGVPRLWTGVGLVLLSGGSFFLFRDVDGASLRPSWLTLLVGIGGAALTYIVGMPSMTRTRFGTPTIGREWMVGSQGVALDDISPEGTVRVHEGAWRARTNRATPIGRGATVNVVAIDGVTLEVEPLEGAAKDYRERH
ncbi:MAG: NfeD family protein [Actinomycetota bacterium]